MAPFGIVKCSELSIWTKISDNFCFNMLYMKSAFDMLSAHLMKLNKLLKLSGMLNFHLVNGVCVLEKIGV